MALVALRIAQTAFLVLVATWIAGSLWPGLPAWVLVVALVLEGVGGITAVVLGIRAFRASAVSGGRSQSLWAIWTGGVTAVFPVIALIATLIFVPITLFRGL